MILTSLIDYAMDRPGTSQDFPFDQETMVIRVGGKIFLLTNVTSWQDGEATINLKCEPKRAIELREAYSSVTPGYHMNKKHWNTVLIEEGELSDQEIFDMIDHSYDLVVASLSNKLKKDLGIV